MQNVKGGMNMYSIQVQSVLYNNEKEAIHRSLTSLANSVRVCNEKMDEKVELTVSYGDASAKPIFSNDEIARFQSEFSDFLKIKYTFFNENTGTAKGHNKLGENNESEFMLIMNPDVLLAPKCLMALLKPFLNAKLRAGMTEARQTPIEHPKEFNKKTGETSWAATACALFKTEDFKKLDGFDYKTFFMYCDDLDFSWRIRLLGKKVYYCPDAMVFHAKRLDSKGGWKPTKAEIYYSAEAAILMAHKWSNSKRCKQLYSHFLKSEDENLVKAAKHYEEMRKSGQLPKPLDPDHKVATFVGDNYTEHRFGF